MRETITAPTGQELETLPGAQPVLKLLDTVVERSGGQRRDGQRTMAAQVAQALELERHLLVQAGTGTGKSLGYLVPAIQAAQRSEKPIIVATATLALQAQIVNRDIPRLLDSLAGEVEAETDVAILKGRNNYLCLHKLEGGYPEEETSLTLRSQLLVAARPEGWVKKSFASGNGPKRPKAVIGMNCFLE